MGNNDLQKAIHLAIRGDQLAMDKVIREIETLVLNVAAKKLGNLDDAKDARQEILLKVVRYLPSFRQKGSLNSWVYKICVNHLLTIKSRAISLSTVPIDNYVATSTLSFRNTENIAERKIGEEEMMDLLSHWMLCSLTCRERLAYILANFLDFDSIQAAQIMGMSRANFRKILSRTRIKLRRCAERLGTSKASSRGHYCHKNVMCNNEKQFVSAPIERLSLTIKISMLERLIVAYRTDLVFSQHTTFIKKVREAVKNIYQCGNLVEVLPEDVLQLYKT